MLSSLNLTICGKNLKPSSTDKVKTKEDITMCQSAGKTFDDGMRLGWLACAIESEGSLMLTWGKRKDGYIQIVPRINLGNLSNEYIERALEISHYYGVGGNVSNHTSKIGMKYILWYGMKRVKKILELISLHMADVRKKEISECILEFINYRLSVNLHVKYSKIEKDLFLKVRSLNGKGRIPNAMLKCQFENESSTTNTSNTDNVSVKRESGLAGDCKKQAEMTCSIT